jgi:hypothetical protein
LDFISWVWSCGIEGRARILLRTLWILVSCVCKYTPIGGGGGRRGKREEEGYSDEICGDPIEFGEFFQVFYDTG